MAKLPRFLSQTTLVAILVGSALFLDACSCQDDLDPLWTFEDPDEFEPDAAVVHDLWEEEEEEPEEIDEEDWDWAFPDEEIEPDPPEWDETEWQVEVIDDGIPRTFADNDRTSVIVDREGTVWLGYHRCDDPQCTDPMLVVGHRRANSEDWNWENIESHTGLFGLQAIHADEPLVIYLDGVNRELKAASREANGRWLIEALPVDDASRFDGFDVSRDRARFYVSHAFSDRNDIEFFTYNTAANNPFWRRLQPLNSASSAAYERGLRGGNQLNFFLVHRDTVSGFRLSEYDLGTNEWTRSTQAFPAAISSLLVRQNGEICTAGPSTGDILVTCGTFDEPFQRRDYLLGRDVYYLSSMIEARDETLFVAFHDSQNQDLYVSRQAPGEEWSREYVHDGETFGISTAVDHRDHLLMTFYHCDASSCAIHLVERTP